MSGAVLATVDAAELRAGGARRERAAAVLEAACRESGFFYAVGHGVDEKLAGELERQSRRFFALDDAAKRRIHMARGGRAWRGWFPVGGELTSGRPDQKEGLYFGTELDARDPRVVRGLALHGPNLFPDEVPELRPAVLAWLDAMTGLCHTLMEGISLSLGLAPDYFRERYTAEPTVLFRIFHYPALPPDTDPDVWSVGEHSDYGLLTVLRQTGPGLQVKVAGQWHDAPPLPGSLVCNVGDMLDRMTAGRYRSAPHRVRNESGRSRLSFPFFFDPGWDAEILPLDSDERPRDDADQRWDRASVHAFRGTYGEYLLGKVSKVFPELAGDVL